MASDPQDPFAVDKDVPDIGKGDEPSPFEFSIEDVSASNLPSLVPSRPFPWLVVGSIAGGLLFVIAIGILVSSLLRRQAPILPAVIPTPTPSIRTQVEAPVRCFYQSLDDMDTSKADLPAVRECFDPDIAWVDNLGAILSRIWPAARTILPADVWDKASQATSKLNITLDFQDLEIRAAEPLIPGVSTAQVGATSNLYIRTADGGLLWKQHLNITHPVVRKQNRWYLTLSGPDKAPQ